jgi:RNA polymerase-binding protein DksA
MNQPFTEQKSRLETLARELNGGIQSTSGELQSDALDGWRGPDTLAETQQMRLVSLELKTRQEQRLMRVQSALKSIEKGTYGICRKCGGQISRERLEVQPEAFLCVRCADC